LLPEKCLDGLANQNSRLTAKPSKLDGVHADPISLSRDRGQASELRCTDIDPELFGGWRGSRAPRTARRDE
jgi:hypothetical protein